jgi:hypothetical protein
MIELGTWGTYGGRVHYLVDGREVSKEQYQTARELELLIKELV